MINTVILDFDGTIGDTCSLIVRTMQQTLDAVGLPMQSDAQCAAMIGLPLRQCFSQLMPMDDVTAARCESTYREIFARNNADYKVQVFPQRCRNNKATSQLRDEDMYSQQPQPPFAAGFP